MRQGSWSGHREGGRERKEEEEKREKGTAVARGALVNAVMSIDLTAGLVASVERTGRVGSESLLSDWDLDPIPSSNLLWHQVGLGRGSPEAPELCVLLLFLSIFTTVTFL